MIQHTDICIISSTSCQITGCTEMRSGSVKILHTHERKKNTLKQFWLNSLVLKGFSGVPPIDDLQLLWSQTPDTGPLSLIILFVHVGSQANRHTNSGGPFGSSSSFTHCNPLRHSWTNTRQNTSKCTVQRQYKTSYSTTQQTSVLYVNVHNMCVNWSCRLRFQNTHTRNSPVESYSR